ncbi:ABC transporter ATP-binding protein [Phycisphaera mikurensis]|uniref:Putative ABC transporter permease/ATP-binding protein n=1 Tax=Phycisphaera mikurensis (strain NBRC 102666 / KCTC 22515 / FYK2301M01) TaxID=1142394 RepID=I0IAV6_PHYMF|nr:ABC transporter ATP-binding protein [Phycisphaera mikurensis]MBB6442632.1 ATP-binding cassette subfamily B protein [Phycisphaera mikurensis]BAM02394.1 putative ABC transporter permease/ATP-binding protein [Phycisphaera mikurensis NBRC 102666]
MSRRRPDPAAAEAPGATLATAITRLDLKARAEEEGPARAPLRWPLVRRLWSLTTPYAGLRNTLLVLTCVRGIQLPALPWILSAVIAGPLAARNWPGVLWGSAGFLALLLFTAVTFHYRMKLSLVLGEVVVQDLRRDLFGHLQKLGMRYYDRTKVGAIISRMTSDAEALRQGIQDVVFVSLVNVGHMVIASLIMAWYDLPLFGFVLAMSPLIWAIHRFFGSRLGTAWREVQSSMSRVTATLAESVSGIRVTQGFVRQERNAALFHELVSDHAGYNLRASRLSGVYIPLLDFNSQLFLAGLLVLGGWQVLHGGLPGFGGEQSPAEQAATFAALVVFIFQLPPFFLALRVVARQHNTALTAMAGAERVFALLDTEPEVLDEPDAAAPETIRGEVVFDDVSFGYDPKRPVLHGISFKAEPGQTIALVGHTGSGKSTVIKLISKFYLPTGGRVLIDGIATPGLRTEALMAELGIVLQSNFLFTGTVMDNIRMGQPSASDADVVAAAKKLDCLDLLEQLPEGLHTAVGERGGALSLGQRQLVCFCRAMLADPRLLILDEATSSVDGLTEARIQKALNVLLRGRTSFVVAHRLSTIRHASRVIVLDHGKIIESGRHNELLREGGVYAGMYRQFIRAGEAAS